MKRARVFRLLSWSLLPFSIPYLSVPLLGWLQFLAVILTNKITSLCVEAVGQRVEVVFDSRLQRIPLELRSPLAYPPDQR